MLLTRNSSITNIKDSNIEENRKNWSSNASAKPLFTVYILRNIDLYNDDGEHHEIKMMAWW